MANEHNLKPAKKGEVRNPKGRPKGSKNRSTIIRHWLQAVTDGKNPITGDIDKMSVDDRLTLSILAKAMKGDTQAYKALMDSAYGQPKQQMEIDHSGGINIKPIEWVKESD